MSKINLTDNILEVINKFVDKYDNDALLTALNNYDLSQQKYICKTKTYMKQIPISSINYIEILGHDILIHTDNETLTKYGTLKEEYNKLKKFGFIKCNQSFIVPINKITEIRGKNLILATGDRFSLSRNCISEVISTYTNFRTDWQ